MTQYPYDKPEAILDLDAAIATLSLLVEEGGLFSQSAEAFEKEYGPAFLMSYYDTLGTTLAGLQRQIIRARNELEKGV